MAPCGDFFLALDSRKGARNLFAGFNTRTGRVYGACFARKRQAEFITFLEGLSAQ
ncbi:MAG: hypothetical protein IT204_22260, partial [Fimbriimonadaceae bacterium]|nr:hypothetical protein [Fimbriimonadaceae bacterium]